MHPQMTVTINAFTVGYNGLNSQPTHSWLSPSLILMIFLMWSAVSVDHRNSSGLTVQ